MTYPDMPEGRVQVHQDGKAVSPVLPNADEAFVWLMKHQGQSAFYALTHGGYSIERTWAAQVGEQIAPVVETYNYLVGTYSRTAPAARNEDLGAGPLVYVKIGEDPSYGDWYAYVATPLLNEAIAGPEDAEQYAIGYDDGAGGEHTLRLPASTPVEMVAGALLGAWLRGSRAYHEKMTAATGEKIADPAERAAAERAIMR